MAITRRETSKRENERRQQSQQYYQQQSQDESPGTGEREDQPEPHPAQCESTTHTHDNETEASEASLESEDFPPKTVAMMDRIAWEAIANRCAPPHAPEFARPRANTRRPGCSRDNNDQIEREFHTWFDLDAENRKKRVGEVLSFLLDFLTDIDRVYNLSLLMHFARGESDPAKRGQPGTTNVVHWASRSIQRNPEYSAAARESAEIFDTRIAEPRQEYYRIQIKQIRAEQEKEWQWQQDMLLHVASQKKERDRKRYQAEEAERERQRKAAEEERNDGEEEELACAPTERCTIARRIHFQNISTETTPGTPTSRKSKYIHSIPRSIVTLLNEWQEPLGVSNEFLVTLDAIFRHLPPHCWATALRGYDLEDELIHDIFVLYTKGLESDGFEMVDGVKEKGKQRMP
ncbi:hypothetical protein BOTBODRAFT_46972 [Botryobasidium botryosum FD-172 SS1]|uniref:Uncharacterized protein n=1 Tax=Botryobasidium botryosum (strain FD-172 SS1) TaxID=930990 RepID=A0A067M4B1_BOTB1|nr:hypothetical protein BOTBODRAFT_46972 [Botryobasidium botryosum FD-172 SS1]